MRRRISIRGCVRPLVRRSVRPSVPSYFQTRTRRILCRVSGLVLFYFVQIYVVFQTCETTVQFHKICHIRSVSLLAGWSVSWFHIFVCRLSHPECSSSSPTKIAASLDIYFDLFSVFSWFHYRSSQVSDFRLHVR